MPLFSPIQETSRGLKAFLRGVTWLKAHPRYLAYLAVPGVLGLVFLVGGISTFVTYDQQLMDLVLFAKPTGDGTAYFLFTLLYYLCYVLLYVATIVLALLASFLLMNVIASPIYEIVSIAVERDFTGREPEGLSFLDGLRVMLIELKKVALILVLSIILLLIPGFNVLSTLAAAFLVGWDFFDYPLARRGWSLGRRLRFVAGEFWSVLGFGLWLIIPFVQLIMLPLAVAGGTLLNLEALERERLLTSSGRRLDASS